MGWGWVEEPPAWRTEGLSRAGAAVQALRLHLDGDNFPRRFGALGSDAQLLGRHLVLPSFREQCFVDVVVPSFTLEKTEWLVSAFAI